MNGKTAGTQATLSRNGACVELTIANNGVSGAVTQAGQDAQPFSAVPATGDAGIYRAEWSMAGASYRINWIVLADGSQREIPT